MLWALGYASLLPLARKRCVLFVEIFVKLDLTPRGRLCRSIAVMTIYENDIYVAPTTHKMLILRYTIRNFEYKYLEKSIQLYC